MKKILYVILPLALAFALAAGVALSAWQFESVGKSSNELTDMRDDIFENYNIKKADDAQVNTVNTYEIYLYPSTLYLNDYIDCLNNEAGAVLPEEKYGYIEPVVATDGTVTYNVVDKGGDNGYLADVAKNDSYTMDSAEFVKGMYYNVYMGNSDWDTTINNGLSGMVKVGTVNVAANSKYLYGDPESDKNAVNYSDSTTGVSLQDTTGERHNWRNLHYYDRFGYWATRAKDEGRYLPLKITVDENFSNTYYDNVALSPFADMGDPHDWYVYSFSCWAYIAHSENGFTLPYYAMEDFAQNNGKTNYVNADGSANPSLGSFCPTAVSQYFDIIESFEKYSDENGVIRLFPKFSNGKGYNAPSIEDGGGDAVKVVPELKDENGNKTEMGATDQHELYMFYSTDKGTFTSSNTTVNVRVSVLPNIDIDDYYRLNFKIALTPRVAGWPGGWTDIYSLGRETSDGTNKNIPETLKSYGYGMYNLYLFITQVAESTGTTDYTANLETMRQNLVNKSDTVNFQSLFGKNLLPIASSFAGDNAGGKSFMLVAEKVREAKFIGDVNFGNTNYTTEEQVEEKYLSTNKSFRLINKELYGYEAGSPDKGESTINSQFPYCYILQNVDFTEATTQYCQIRFQRNYRSDLHFAELDEYKYDKIEFSGVIYERGFGNYFKLVNANVYSQDGTTAPQQVIQLASEEMRGVYDIILVFRSAREVNPDSDIAYNIGLYAYRHTNIFLKVFEENPTGTVNYYQGSDGAFIGTDGEGSGKAYEFIDHYSTLTLFNKSYPIGVSINGTDVNEGGSVNLIGSTLAECVNGAVKEGYDPTKVKLYDHVTGAEVAHYELREGVTTNTDNYYLEYGGKYYELVFNPFKIRKNYIFYISYE